MHRKRLTISRQRKVKQHSRDRRRKLLKAIDFFCGAGGMSYGLAKAKIKVLAGIDCDESCRETYERNNKPAKFIEKNIAELSPSSLTRTLGISRNDDRLVFVACSPCQFWTKVNTDKRKSKSTVFLLAEFERFVDWFRPGFVLIENVPGLQSKKRPSILPPFKKFLRSRGYAIAHGVINANHFGVPQNRKRYLLIATRLTANVRLPGRTKVRPRVEDYLGVVNGFPSIPAGYKDKTVHLHVAAALSPKNLRRIAKTPPNGGTRKSWANDPELQIPAYKGKDNIFRDVYGRMYWKRPAPTITTRFNSLSNGRFGHPEENRAISLREGASLQTFPKHYAFKATNQATVARQIGNAVPPALAKRIGHHLSKLSRETSKLRYGR
jgi:DNA (cytosine-5)-methyltransferase 1